MPRSCGVLGRLGCWSPNGTLGEPRKVERPREVRTRRPRLDKRSGLGVLYTEYLVARCHDTRALEQSLRPNCWIGRAERRACSGSDGDTDARCGIRSADMSLGALARGGVAWCSSTGRPIGSDGQAEFSSSVAWANENHGSASSAQTANFVLHWGARSGRTLARHVLHGGGSGQGSPLAAAESGKARGSSRAPIRSRHPHTCARVPSSLLAPPLKRARHPRICTFHNHTVHTTSRRPSTLLSGRHPPLRSSSPRANQRSLIPRR
ncbi:hypothetical protein VTN77DRAFT_1818 [Rasamsonia byssochlamydoides]|uniref:uncharacterized protein n=1 Tax=Rasamsonia byssochlamydoides TaxID=89139 RepID=UPI003743383D